MVFVLGALVSIWGADRLIKRKASDKLFSAVTEIPHQRVGLVPGTAKYLVDGRINLYYHYRIEAAVKLFEAGKIDYIIVSGDNSTVHYDEPSAMKRDLVKHGVPAEKIYLDYAGFRTLDSVVRSKEVFGQNEITVISQRFQNERAIYIAHKKGINAIGFNAEDVNAYYGFKTNMRERLARVKMMLDLIFSKQPKFLGEPIGIG